MPAGPGLLFAAVGSSTVEVAVDAAGLGPSLGAAVRAALADAGFEVRDGGGAGVVVTGAVAAGVKLLGAGAAPIVCVAEEPTRSAVTELLAAGASGVVPLDDVGAALPAAIHAVVSGLVVVPEAGARAVRRPVLTSREKQILGLVVLGLTNAAIGRRLYLAESTVKYHLLSVYDKLGVRTRKEAADLVLDPRNGLDVGVLGMSRSGSRSRAGGYSVPSVR